MSELSKDDLDLIRQWFNAVEDINPDYLNSDDYKLAKRIYNMLGVKVPRSVETQA